MLPAKLINSKAPLLILGETGTGKSRLAREIHEKSSSRKSAFMTLHLASVSENLIESELFGHVRGAFTGAIFAKKGYLELVGEGTLFLDEVGELSLEGQKKLLYLLEERKFNQVGGNEEKNFSGRVIAATNKDLAEMVRQGEFREDLYYRLMVFTHKIPPLREDRRKLESLIDILCSVSLPPDIKTFMLNHSWPGNVRQLKNCIEYWEQLGELPDWILGPEKISENICKEYPLDYHKALEQFEKGYFEYVVRHFGGRINETARKLVLSKSTLIAKIRKYDINVWKIKGDSKRKDYSAVAA